jgi:hypothetical protein
MIIGGIVIHSLCLYRSIVVACIDFDVTEDAIQYSISMSFFYATRVTVRRRYTPRLPVIARHKSILFPHHNRSYPGILLVSTHTHH